METIGKIVMSILDHYDRHERVYKYIVFPVGWVLALYSAGVVFFLTIQVMLEMVQ